MQSSLDPRIKRLNITDLTETFPPKQRLDQFQSYEVFLQVKEGKMYEHVGIVHAPDREMALIFAKEQFSRRPGCTGLWVVKTEFIKVTPYAEGDENIYELPLPSFEDHPDKEQYEIFHLKKRGKQHVHQGAVLACCYEEALAKAKIAFNKTPVLNVWIFKEKDMLGFHQDDKDIWSTLAEKSHRNVTSYKTNEKLMKFKGQ